MHTYPRPLPDTDNRLYLPYIQGLKKQLLLVQKCLHCADLQWPPREFCPSCNKSEFDWIEVQQEGEVYTYSIVYRAPHPWFNSKVPYGIVIVELENGVRMIGNYFEEDVENIECGMKMKAQFEHVNDDITVLKWKKV
ncbi:Zn-ribbon domain-containing OB-fold protein [Bacillus dakarensis]|uniref:Zn-ribbon domain-containing OB-fold protein n=1 Tax=Robertmurraya dakarensis TaxID=1926278 RepID=UPI000982649C|nr:OB-fold domain-containing protein [Bacillus dakarensis]